MIWTWQDIFALSIVSVAVVYVVRSAYRRLRRRGARTCGSGCFGCAQPNPEASELVTAIGSSESVSEQVPRVE